MGRVVSMSNDSLRTSLFGDNTSYMSSYLDNQMQQMSNVYGGVGNIINHSLYQSLQQSYDYVNDNLRRYHIQQELETNNLSIAHDHFERYDTFEEIQNANPIMQRYIMSMPELRGLYNDGHCDGYSGSYQPYIDPEYTYNQILDGVQQIDENGDGFFEFYMDDLVEGDAPLNINQQHSILGTLDTVRHIMRTCDYDPTRNSAKPQRLIK